MSEFDLVVLGTGGAAMAAGIEARSRGKSVVLVEHGPLGGALTASGRSQRRESRVGRAPAGSIE